MQNSGTLSVRAHERTRAIRSFTPERVLHGRGLFEVILLLIQAMVWVAWKARPYRGECA